ncbi:General negative regulator of transcription subunit [Pelomyxa schiedti]|nr:General negative regulator of transcription subunit [Pelomyxa schiedti]
MKKQEAEIDRVLRKVGTWAAAFDAAMTEADLDRDPPGSPAARHQRREKREIELKRLVKKMQRHRDQIKEWSVSNVFKTKVPILTAARKQIESKMEHWRVYEHCSKVKPYSREALEKELRENEQAISDKAKMRAWIVTAITKFEKAKEASQDKYEIESYAFHLDKLQLLLKMLTKNKLAASQVQFVQDAIDPVFADPTLTTPNPDLIDDQLYDDLHLEELDTTSSDEESSDSDTDSLDSPTQTSTQLVPSLSSPPINAQQPISTLPTPSRQASPPQPPLPPPFSLKQSSVPIPPTQKSSHTPQPQPTKPQESILFSSVSSQSSVTQKQKGSVKSQPTTSLANKPTTLSLHQITQNSQNTQRTPTQQSYQAYTPPQPYQSYTPPIHLPQSPQPQQPHTQLNTQTQLQMQPQPQSQPQQTLPNSPSPQYPPGQSNQTLQQSLFSSTFKDTNDQLNTGLPSMDSLASSIQNTTSPAQPSCNDLSAAHPSWYNQSGSPSQWGGTTNNPDDPSRYGVGEDYSEPPIPRIDNEQSILLNSSFYNLTQPDKAQEPSPANITGSTLSTSGSISVPTTSNTPSFPSWMPSEVCISMKDVLPKVPTDTLFFVFYMRSLSHLKFLAGKELQRRHWWYHIKHQLWFQPSDSAQSAIDSTQGEFSCFDLENWKSQIRQNFIFEYSCLGPW